MLILWSCFGVQRQLEKRLPEKVTASTQAAQHKRHLVQLGITHVLCVATALELLFPELVTYCRISVQVRRIWGGVAYSHMSAVEERGLWAAGRVWSSARVTHVPCGPGLGWEGGRVNPQPGTGTVVEARATRVYPQETADRSRGGARQDSASENLASHFEDCFAFIDAVRS